MGVYDGAAHLPEQLASLAAQRHTNWRLTCSDDGSGDDSRAMIQQFASEVCQDVKVVTGPQVGFSANFMSMIAVLPDAPGIVALCDQDDVWLESKLARAVQYLDAVPGEMPALYCSRVILWHPEQDTRTAGRGLPRAASFRNALIENVAQGNTIVLNNAAAALAARAARRTGPIFAHDWWLYLLITGAGGCVVFDETASLLYRQHGRNAIGAGTGFGGQIRRKAAVLRGAYAARLAGNVAALEAVRDLLTPDAADALGSFAAARRTGPWGRIMCLRRAGVYRQRRLSDVSFWLGALIGRI
jgi:glycosyltransferase involved in cell wall biosynthesis